MQAKRHAFDEALAAGGPPALTWDEVEGLWPAASDSLRSRMASAVESIGRRAADNTAGLRTVLILDSLILLAALALSVCGLIAVSRRVVKPIHQLTEAMTGLAQGDVSVQISANGRKDEIAAMASAVEVFRGNAIERKRLEAKRSEEHTSELQSLMRISYAVFCLKKK